MLLLSFGFFVCGFQVTFIATHLPAYLSDMGLAAGVGSTSLALIGLFNIFGTLAAGWLGATGRSQCCSPASMRRAPSSSPASFFAADGRVGLCVQHR